MDGQYGSNQCFLFCQLTQLALFPIERFRVGLSAGGLDELLTWSRPEFFLAGLALSRLEILRKHEVWADSTNWLWWDARYDYQRFGHRNALQEVLG